MTTKKVQQSKLDPKRYCGIVFIGGGSSWCWAPTIEEAAEKAVAQAVSDWKHLFKFEKGADLGVLVYDMADHSGWYADSPGVVKSKDTRQRIEAAAMLRLPIPAQGRAAR